MGQGVMISNHHEIFPTQIRSPVNECEYDSATRFHRHRVMPLPMFESLTIIRDEVQRRLQLVMFRRQSKKSANYYHWYLHAQQIHAHHQGI